MLCHDPRSSGGLSAIRRYAQHGKETGLFILSRICLPEACAAGRVR